MRTCTVCNEEMHEGYLNEETGDTYCSASCLDQALIGMSQTIEAMDEDELDESHIFWTTWEEEDETDLPLALGVEPSAPTTNVKVEGHRGTWYTIATETFGLKGTLTDLFLMEHETYGDEAPCIIVDGTGELVMENVHNGFDDLRYCIAEDIDPMEY